MTHPSLGYDNRTGRRPGRVVRTMSALVPGVRRVWRQAAPYADAWHGRNLETIDRPGRRWIVLGDSMSQGIGASSYDAGWVGQLAARVAADGYDLQIVNLSATGACVADVLAQQLPALERLGVRPDDLVTVMVGSNDLFGGRARRAGLPGAYARMVDAVPAGSLVATLPQPSGPARAANVFVEAADASGRIVMVDLRVTGPSSWRGRLAADYFHPNDAGYAAIAEAFEPTVRRVLALPVEG
ncbi:SGNH/GDSL hydrolase family protein [Allobranchiibius sp. CTAmp26]|uniref:SGNH/GDSL hydrolase family protein n=1 Tax=Allobranchiibius sp. CTAmp26 TaxID=2815214 RepID=UPI001AA0C9CC|nr:SGNH/GDSL hydrolase family protein [Allobranchiibius sp. CTAmp26]MBO1754817.1 SGNH/GDSL hydrolase family protein [Allobranchiibius sp. CTAmp26]